MRPAVDHLIAVVRPDATELAVRLVTASAEVHIFADADRGMGASLAYGVAQTSDADSWLVALGDMPLIAHVDAMRIADALRTGAPIAVPTANGRRGHPVGFSRRFSAELMALNDDVGSRTILASHPADVVEIEISDARTWHDIDNSEDLEVARRLLSRA